MNLLDVNFALLRHLNQYSVQVMLDYVFVTVVSQKHIFGQNGLPLANSFALLTPTMISAELSINLATSIIFSEKNYATSQLKQIYGFGSDDSLGVA